MDIARPRLAVRVDNEGVDLQTALSAYSMGSAQSVPPNGRLDTAFTASANRMLGEMFSSDIPLFKLG